MKPTQIVILDDELNILHALTRLLRTEAFGIVTTTNHEEALQALLDDKGIKVVLSDQRMPAISGVDFLTKVKESRPDIVRILFTGYTDIQAAEDAINKGAVYRFINKPWNDEDMRTTVRQAIEYYDLQQERANLLEVTRQQNEELKKLDRLKSEFIANVSHELRTPVNVINIAMSNLKAGIAGDLNSMPPKLREYLERIDRNIGNLRIIIDDLLDIFKLSDDSFSLSLADISLGPLINDEVAEMLIHAEHKGVTLKAEAEGTLELRGDGDRIRQVLRNLLSNAIKFTPSGGSVTVRAYSSDQKICCSVADTGPGIPESEWNAVFDRFRQVEQKAEGKPKGTGLGLAICKRIIELHGGTVWVENGPEAGSIFTFAIPRGAVHE